VTEPKTYDGTDFGDGSGALAISEMLYSVARKGGVTRETYRAMVGIINDKIIPAAVDKVTDLFDGAMYKGMVGSGFFDSPHDVAITLGIDGFAPFNKGLFTATIVNMTIMNIDPKN
ncbi:hypothetical protein, partial, partial [Absidia glauca]